MDPEFARGYHDSASGGHWWFEGRKALVRGLLKRRGVHSGHFLDVGSGSQTLFVPELTVVEVDVIPRGRTDGRFVQASAEQLPFRADSFDGAGLFDVLEHLDRPQVCLAEVRRVLRPGGMIVVTVPAHQWLWSTHDTTVEHRRRYEIADLTDLLEEAGFVVEWVSAFYGFLLVPAVVRALLRRGSSMMLPPEPINRLMKELAMRSIERALRSPSRLGLSVAATGFTP